MFFVRNCGFRQSDAYSFQNQKKRFWQKAFLDVLREGVLTVELAFILPLFLLGTATLIGFMDVMKTQTERVSQLCEKAMEEGIYAYAAVERQTEIELSETYAYRLSVSLVPLPAMVMTNRVQVHSWVGMEREEVQDAAEEMVYVSESGSVYHTNPQCSYVELSISQAAGADVESLRNQYGAKYAPCESCSKGMPPAEIVYITGQGTRYHNLISCSRLKRTVWLIPLSETRGRPLCSRCRKNRKVEKGWNRFAY